MLPIFTSERKRKMNLGGSSSTPLRTSSIVGQAHLQRQERGEVKRRRESAVRVQGWWRGVQEGRRVRGEVKGIFYGDVGGVDGLRSFVLVGGEGGGMAGLWSRRMMESGVLEEFIEERSVLLRKACLLVLKEVARSPMTPDSMYHVQVLNKVMSAQKSDITLYIVQHGYYSFLSKAIQGIPVGSRGSPVLPLLITLTTIPLGTFPTQTLTPLFTQILTIGLLLYRLPVHSLTALSSNIPFSLVHLLHLPSVAAIGVQDKLNLLATLHPLVSPRYQLLPPSSLQFYFTLLTLLINHTPISLLNPPTSDPHSDSEFTPSTSTPFSKITQDPRTTRRISTLPSPHHIASLLTPSSHHTPQLLPSLLHLLLALSAPWPTVIPALLAHPAGIRLIGAVYRSHVRASSLARHPECQSETPLALSRVQGYQGEWGPLLFVTELYERALRTMGDDEFFGTLSDALGPGLVTRGEGHVQLQRNPLSLDELAAFSKQLLDIVFVLYWRDDGGALEFMARHLPGLELEFESTGTQSDMASLSPLALRATYQTARTKLTKCLVAIHARDSRNPFLAPGHWLVVGGGAGGDVSTGIGGGMDMQSFIEAAIFEEQNQHSLSPSSPSPSPSHSSSHPHKSHNTQTHTHAPRLAILNNIPFAIPFSVRVSMFRNFVKADRYSHSRSRSRSHHGHGHAINPRVWLRSLVEDASRDGDGALDGAGGEIDTGAGGGGGGGGGAHQQHHHPQTHGGKTRIQVRRGRVAEDGFDKLAGVDLKAQVEITFVDQFGAEEAGIDGGGVFKEFFTALCKEVFDTDRGLWLANVKRELYPNPHVYATEGHSLNWYRFIGRILGKAMYEGILVDVAFAGFFLAKWLDKQSFLDDLASLDPDLYNGLIFLKHYTGNLEDLSLNFTVAVDDFGIAKTNDLVPNGSNIAVTRENRLQYIYLMSHYRLSKQIKMQSRAFFDGLSDLIDPRWIRMFNQQEIQILLGGVNAPVDFDDLRRNTNYGGLYDDNEPTIVAFWKVVNSFDHEERRALLRFVTSCSRPPLLGFKELVPNFSIRDAGSDQLRLPTASTCVNLLKLPRYASERVLREKLVQAITSNAGFDLS